MSISATRSAAALIDDYGTSLASLLGSNVVSSRPVNRGGNGKVYRIECDDSRRYIIKFYFQNSFDRRDRLGTEFKSLDFLWAKGVRSIPRPVVSDVENGFVIYEYIEGRRVSPSDVSAGDVDHVVRFLVELKDLGGTSDSKALPAASEACFSPRDAEENIGFRLRLLLDSLADSPHADAKRFLENDFIPAFRTVTCWVKSTAKKAGIPYEAELSYEERTLSPSDFGFHNAVRRPDGNLAFIDFEYFGWDDPAKMISDFILHPAMRIGERLKRLFLARAVESFHDTRLGKRIEVVYPLFGLKWCLIMLNEFVPGYLERRKFSGKAGPNEADLQIRQLKKARILLRKIKNEYTRFPYSSAFGTGIN